MGRETGLWTMIDVKASASVELMGKIVEKMEKKTKEKNGKKDRKKDDIGIKRTILQLKGQ